MSGSHNRIIVIFYFRGFGNIPACTLLCEMIENMSKLFNLLLVSHEPLSVRTTAYLLLVTADNNFYSDIVL